MYLSMDGFTTWISLVYKKWTIKTLALELTGD